MTYTSAPMGARVWNSVNSLNNQGITSNGIVTSGLEAATINDRLGYWSLILNRLRSRTGTNAHAHDQQYSQQQQSQDGSSQQAGSPPPGVQEYLTTLEQIYTELKQVVEQRGQLEQQIHEVRAALEKARQDIVGVQQSERQARHLALHDGLTRLPNRNYFSERLVEVLAQAERQGREAAVMFIDLDGFKPINDRHGHHTGDELLTVIATRLTSAVRADDMVSRLGGDEFGCVIADLPPQCNQLGRMARDLYETVSAPCRLANQSVVVRPSIGIARYPADGSTAEDLLRKADVAMYRAKANRTGHEFFNANINTITGNPVFTANSGT